MASSPPTDTPQYIRKWKLTIQTWGGLDIEVPEEQKIVFHVEKSITRIFQFSTIEIINLNPGTETDIFKNARAVVLEAGYQNGAYGEVFKGSVRQVIRGKHDGTTYFVRLICIDGDDKLNIGFANLVLTEGKDAETIINQIARSSAVPFNVRVKGDLSQQQTQRGKAVFGSPFDFLRSIAQNNNATVYTEDGDTTISALSQSPPPVVPELHAGNGMIGMPFQIDQGIRVRTLINPSMRLDSWFKLNNQKIIQAQVDFLSGLQTLLDLDGVYRIIEIVITGDTRGNDWYFDITAVSQTGSLPAMLAAGNQSGVS